MGLIPAIIAGAGAIVGAAVAKIIADDAKQWTPWVTQRLTDIAVRRLPEGQRARYAEEWAAHLDEVPGVVGKLAVTLQFQIAAFAARELDAKARLDTWRNEKAAALVGIKTMVRGVLALTQARRPSDEADEDVGIEHVISMEVALRDIIQRCDEVEARRPDLGITIAAAALIADHIFGAARSKIRATARKAQTWPVFLRDGVLRVLGRFDE